MRIKTAMMYFAVIALAAYGSVSLAATGGPDAFGYTYTDSAEPDGPTYAFYDISGTGASIAFGDDTEMAVPIGFTFSFYNASADQVTMSSNGYLTWGPDGTDFSNDCPLVEGGLTPPLSIFAYWDDLDPGDDGALAYYENFAACPVGAATGCTIFQWEEFDFFPGDGVPGGNAGTFQAILYDTNDWVVQYEGGPGLDGAGATVGQWEDTLANSLLYTCNGGGIGRLLAIEFGVEPPLELIDVPTLNQVGTAIFAGLLLLLAMAGLRRRTLQP